MAQILGIKLSDLNYQKLLSEIKTGLNRGDKKYIVTPNPEIILAALNDSELKNIINRADFSLADGVGLKIAGFLKGKKIVRVTGADLSFKLLDLASSNNYKVAIIIWEKGLSNLSEVNEALTKKYPKLKFLTIKHSRQDYLASTAIKEINQFSPDILFVTLGFPEQEKIIAKNSLNFPSVKLALGVGGTFDFLTGKAKRAPKILRYIGLEWLWRLIIQPSRVKRIWRATFIFMFKVLTYREKK
jgi:N-acetylglucosaminyldiphosphoundecaprenol N-acetyl-beta-D-mannosaminyltransferase